MIIKQFFFIILLFTILIFININNVESKSLGVFGNCEKNQTAKYKKISSKHGNEEIEKITTNQLSKEQLDKHEMFMKIALDIAIQSKVKFVSIIVSPDDRVLCSGTFSKENAILHSELVAITNCSLAYKMITFENHTIYSTAEPDSLSASAIVWARFKQVVYGSSIKHLYCNACFSSLPIDSTYIFSRGYGIGVENIQIVSGVLQDQTDANFGSYCNSSISSIFKTNPQCKCKNSKLSKENNNGNNNNQEDNKKNSNENSDINKNERNHHNRDDSIDNFFDEIKSDDEFDKEIESSKQVEKSKNKEKKKRHSNYHHHSHTSKDGSSRTSTSTSVSGNGHATASASASSSSSSSSTSTSFSHSSSSSNDNHHKKDKSKKRKDNKEKGDKKDKKEKDKKEKDKKKDKKDKKDKSTSVEEEINSLKIEKNSI
ncbi:hypothetical protein ACTFIV_004678 [Dictyostelium citrinum]